MGRGFESKGRAGWRGITAPREDGPVRRDLKQAKNVRFSFYPGVGYLLST